ncbi:MAG: hypothetical protein GYA34_08095 [Chloroflexi bacterium]|nr:hypothetical protein [Chloroflexota bacterium]
MEKDGFSGEITITHHDEGNIRLIKPRLAIKIINEAEIASLIIFYL